MQTAFILKRKTPPLLHKKGGLPKRLKNKHYVYDLVQDTDILKQPNIDVILTEYVDGLGSKGDKVSVKPNFAYNQLLLPCLAVYATPENIKKYMKDESAPETRHTSPSVQRVCIKYFLVITCYLFNST